MATLVRTTTCLSTSEPQDLPCTRKENAMPDMAKPKSVYVRAYPRKRFGKWESVSDCLRRGKRAKARYHDASDQLDFGF
jgi:hypothetical protein